MENVAHDGTEIELSKSSKLLILLSDFTGETKVDLRLYIQKKGSKEYIPTPKGVSFDPKHLGKVIVALRKLKLTLQDNDS